MGKQKKTLKELNQQLEYYENMKPVNNMGKWARQVAIDKYKKRIENKKNKIEDDADDIDMHIDDFDNDKS